MPRVGNTVGGKYTLQEQIGHGAMGAVWKAIHQTLGRPFAVKFLKAWGLESEQLEQRFYQEARLAASVQHRFVIDIVDFGVTEEGTPYMVMEFLQGEPLSRRLAQRPPLLVRELVRIVAQTAVGLEAVHQAGVIHRDLKPENIMLVPEAGGIIPKLVDFGISRTEVRLKDAITKLTRPGLTVGTPWYMSPEQIRAEKNVDRRSDIYSVGVILYEALAGVCPYDDPDTHELFRKVVLGGADPVMTRRPEIGPYLSAVVERAMALEPDRRFGSASELAAALFSVAMQVPETLACPDRSGAKSGEAGGAVPPPVIPPDGEISSQVMVGVSEASRPTMLVWTRMWRGPVLLGAVVVGLAALGILLVRPSARPTGGDSLATPPQSTGVAAPASPGGRARAPGPGARDEPRTAPAAVPPAIPAAAPAAPAASPEPRRVSATVSAPAATRAVRPAKPTTRAATTKARGRREASRERARADEDRSKNPPEAFTDPGF